MLLECTDKFIFLYFIFFFSFFCLLFFKIYSFNLNYLFYFTTLYWFCHTLTWIHRGCTLFPILNPPRTPSPSHPSGSFFWSKHGFNRARQSPDFPMIGHIPREISPWLNLFFCRCSCISCAFCCLESFYTRNPQTWGLLQFHLNLHYLIRPDVLR